MRLLDRWPKGREGFALALAAGVIAALLGAAAAVYTWGESGGDDESSATPTAETTATRSGDALIPVVSRAGGFSVTAPEALVGDKLAKGVKLSTQSGDIVITVGSTGRDGLAAGHTTTLEAIRANFPKVRVEKAVPTKLGSLEGRRSIGVVRRARGDDVVFSVTTGVLQRRTWSVVMFASRDISPERIEKFYQPVLDGFQPIEAGATPQD